MHRHFEAMQAVRVQHWVCSSCAPRPARLPSCIPSVEQNMVMSRIRHVVTNQHPTWHIAWITMTGTCVSPPLCDVNAFTLHTQGKARQVTHWGFPAGTAAAAALRFLPLAASRIQHLQLNLQQSSSSLLPQLATPCSAAQCSLPQNAAMASFSARPAAPAQATRQLHAGSGSCATATALAIPSTRSTWSPNAASCRCHTRPSPSGTPPPRRR